MVGIFPIKMVDEHRPWLDIENNGEQAFEGNIRCEYDCELKVEVSIDLMAILNAYVSDYSGEIKGNCPMICGVDDCTETTYDEETPYCSGVHSCDNCDELKAKGSHFCKECLADDEDQ